MSEPYYPPAIINDGYSEKGYIAGVPGVHPPIRFVYRRMSAVDQARMFQVADVETDHGNRLVLQADKIVTGNFLLSWDVKDRRGNMMPVTPGHLVNLAGAAFYRIRGIITGTDASDIDPITSATPIEQRAEMATGEKAPVVELKEKNSEAGCESP